MSQMEEGVDSYALDDKCIVPWKDGSVYAGKVQRILEPEQQIVIQGNPTRKAGKQVLLEERTPIDKLKNDKHRRVPASVVNAATETNEKWFYVHYFGWKTNYDEWLPMDRMLPYTPRNINEMKRINAEIKERERLRKEEELQMKKNKKRVASPAAAQGTQPKPSKRQNTETYKTQSSRSASPAVGASAASNNSAAGSALSKPRRKVVLGENPSFEIKLSVPLELKRLLVKDWQLVTRDREIVRLPRPISVVEIMKDFAEASVENRSSGEVENMDHFVDSLVTYFDYAFGMLLLYRFERNQYCAQIHSTPNFKPSLVYGAEHLARLIVSMPSLLSQTASMDDITIQYSVSQLEKLSKFLTDHRSRYFAGEASYDSATRVYETHAIPHLATAPAASTAVDAEKVRSKPAEGGDDAPEAE